MTEKLQQPQEGIVHTYAPRLTAFEFKNASGKQSDNVILFIGGLTDGLLTVPYLPALSKTLDTIGWTVVQIMFTSSYDGFATGSLARDAQEMSMAVKYLKTKRHCSKVVLMGHSTGCQDTMEYYTKLEKSSPEMEVEGGILQAPVSDREMIQKYSGVDKLNELNAEAQELYDKGMKDEMLPSKFANAFIEVPLTVYRWLSFATVEGDDDYFSSDLSEKYVQSIWSKVSKPLLVLYSGEDEFPPEEIDKQKLIDSWKAYVEPKYWSPLSRIIKGATHNVGAESREGALEELCSCVKEFLTTI